MIVIPSARLNTTQKTWSSSQIHDMLMPPSRERQMPPSQSWAAEANSGMRPGKPMNRSWIRIPFGNTNPLQPSCLWATTTGAFQVLRLLQTAASFESTCSFQKSYLTRWNPRRPPPCLPNIQPGAEMGKATPHDAKGQMVYKVPLCQDCVRCAKSI